MVLSFIDKLEKRAKEVNSLLCVGLDPHKEMLSEPSAGAAQAFCREIIESTADVACAFKPNSAFFEAMGEGGYRALRDVIAAVPNGIPVILDAKRGDIASTAQAYATAAFEYLGADAITLSPYLGWDSLEPFLSDPEKGAFILCKTSNPSADEMQIRIVDQSMPLYVDLAYRAVEWNKNHNLGLVVGATDPLALEAVRAAAPEAWMLAPGVGPQGGDLDSALRAGLRNDGLGMLISVSRSIAQAKDPQKEASRLREAINQVRRKMVVEADAGLPPLLKAVANGLLSAGCVRFGSFKLKSGIVSPIYIDLRLLASFPDLLALTAKAYAPILKQLRYDCLAALPYAAIPIGTAVALQMGEPLIYPRKEIKEYGTRASIEGKYADGDCAVVLDDLITTGASKREAIDRLLEAGLAVKDVVVLIDRQGGGANNLEEAGYTLHAVFTLEELLRYWEDQGHIAPDQAVEVREFLGKNDSASG
ncbi:MAG: orotidine-5'-phosphate decarboxylase [Anaerolineales bacterium]|nr:orotidine-5'-phosphate decarboxylase [Anaerolineales bacterium]